MATFMDWLSWIWNWWLAPAPTWVVVLCTFSILGKLDKIWEFIRISALAHQDDERLK